jgi:hypothetical protein
MTLTETTSSRSNPRTERPALSAHRRFLSRFCSDQGDVPGWVLITLMTAGLVTIIWGLAGPALSGVFQQAIDRVSGL